MELFISDKNPALPNAAQIVAEYLDLRSEFNVVKATEESYKTHGVGSDSHFFLKTADGKVHTTPIDALSNLLRKSQYHKVLFGRDDAEIKAVNDFFTNLGSLSTIEAANKYLETRTYALFEHITIADFVLYSTLIPHIKKLNDKDKSTNNHVSRYADFFQHIPVLGQILASKDLIFHLNLEQAFNLSEATSQSNIDKKKNKREDKLKAKEEYFKKQEEQKKEGGENATQTTKVEEKKQNEKKTKEEKKAPADNKPKEENKAPADNKPKEEKKVSAETKPKEEKKGEPKQKQQAKKKEEDELPAISKLDIRVGKIVKIFPNEESDKLYNEEIDIGNGEIRTIASGLKKRIPIEVLQDSMVIVLCNLKGRKLCNWFSHGMLLCASEEGENGAIEPLRPPEGSQPGDPVTIGNFPRVPVAELNPKKNPWDDVKGSLKVNNDCVACYGDVEWTTPKGKVKTPSLKQVHIS